MRKDGPHPFTMSYQPLQATHTGCYWGGGERHQRLGKRWGPGLNTKGQYPGARQVATMPFIYPNSDNCIQSSNNKEKYILALYVHTTIDNGRHLTMNVYINSVSAVALVDSGATGVFMHPNFVKRCGATMSIKSQPREVRVIDGRIINTGLITHEATVTLAVGNHQEVLLADLTNTGRYDCILGIP